LEHQVQADAQAIPTPLERREALVAAADLEGDDGGGRCFL
jgi:hypothetical protein